MKQLKEHLFELVDTIERIVDDKYNPDTYFSSTVNAKNGMFKSAYVLGNLFVKGYSDNAGVNFEIFKDQGTWQIWVWDYETDKPADNQFNTPYYNYDEVRKFMSEL